MNERILAGLADGATVVTGSRRLARMLRHEYDELQRARGAAAWETPSIMPWTGWIGSLWEDFQFTAQDPPTRLGAWQEWALWNSIIRRSPQSAELLLPASAASAAQKAWALAVAWRIKLDRVESEGNDDSRIFAQWAREFASVCESRGWIDGASAPDRLRDALPAIARPGKVLLAGFDELTIIQQAVDDAARRFMKQPRTGRRRAVLIVTDNIGQRTRREQSVVRDFWEADALLSGLIVSSPSTRALRTFGAIIGPQTLLLQAGMEGIAAKTGGDSVHATENGEAFREAMRRIRTRYSLFYDLPAGKPKTKRTIRVELSPETLKQFPGARVKARTGYVAPDQDEGGDLPQISSN
jgi:hypothetical protein